MIQIISKEFKCQYCQFSTKVRSSCHLLPKLSSGVRKMKINKLPPIKTSLIGSHFESQFSSVPSRTPPTRGDASRIPRREHSRFRKLFIYLWYIFNCSLFQLKRFISSLQRLFFSAIQIHLPYWHRKKTILFFCF